MVESLYLFEVLVPKICIVICPVIATFVGALEVSRGEEEKTLFALDLGHLWWFRVQGSGFRVQGPGLRVYGSGFRVQGPGFRVEG